MFNDNFGDKLTHTNLVSKIAKISDRKLRVYKIVDCKVCFVKILPIEGF